MKKLFFLFFIFTLTSLFASNALDDFINKQIHVEAQLLDQNISLNKKIKIQEKQEKTYQDFLFEYASDKKLHLATLGPYYTKVKRLKLRLKNNKYKGYVTAVKRDEVLLKNYAIRQNIRQLLHTILLEVENSTKEVFPSKVNEYILSFFSKYSPLDKEKYRIKNKNNTITKELDKALEEERSLENIVNSFTSALVENELSFFRTARIADAHFFSMLNTINKSPYSKTLNTYLAPFHLDAAKLIAVIAFILIILISIKIMHFLINYALRHYKLSDEDIRYIHSRITSVSNLLASLVILHLIIVAFVGIDLKHMTLYKTFGITYVLIISLLSYRITNTIAYFKIEKMKQSKVLRNEVINLSLKVINGLIVLIALIVILKILGVDLTALLSGLGIAGAAVAFAAKDSIANIFGSISILLGDVFEQGDWIETKDVNGTVVEIGLRASTIRTFDNALISIPNFELSNTGVKNWSRRHIGRRIKMNLALTYESDFDDIQQAILDIREMLKEHEGIANQRTEYRDEVRQSRLVSAEDFQGIKRTTLVYMDTFSESSIDILVYCFSRSVVWDEWLEVKEDVMFKIAKILQNNHLEFAYPTMMLHQAKEEEK